jgi:hypothetical protein
LLAIGERFPVVKTEYQKRVASTLSTFLSRLGISDSVRVESYRILLNSKGESSAQRLFIMSR